MKKSIAGVSTLTKNIQLIKVLISTNSASYCIAQKQFKKLVEALNEKLDTETKLNTLLSEVEFYRYSTNRKTEPTVYTEAADSQGYWYRGVFNAEYILSVLTNFLSKEQVENILYDTITTLNQNVEQFSKAS